MTQQKKALTILGGICAALILLLLISWLVNARVWLAQAIPGEMKSTALIVGLVLTSILLPIGFGLVFQSFTRRYPVSAAYEPTYTQTDLERFQRHYWISALVFLAFAILIGWLSYQLLLIVARGYHALLRALYVIPIDPTFWILPGVFMGIFLAGIPTWFLYRWIMKDRFPRFLAFHNQRFGFDQRSAGQAVMRLGMLLTLTLVLAGLNQHAMVDQEGVATYSFFGLIEQRHAFIEISSLQETIQVDPDNPHIILEHSFTIEYTNGNRWQSISFGNRPVPLVYYDALQFISQESGLPFQQSVSTISAR